jgi:hypothetical protein
MLGEYSLPTSQLKGEQLDSRSTGLSCGKAFAIGLNGKNAWNSCGTHIVSMFSSGYGVISVIIASNLHPKQTLRSVCIVEPGGL